MFDQFWRWLLGHKDITLYMPMSVLQVPRNFVSGESKRRGYSIRVKREKIVIVPKNLWQALAGFPARYRFVGRLSDVHRENGLVSIPGVVTAGLIEKSFIFIWLGIVLTGLVGTLGWAVFLAGKIMLSSGPVPFDELSAIGFILGGGTLVLVGGAMVMTLLRMIYWHERRHLIEFCTLRWRGDDRRDREG